MSLRSSRTFFVSFSVAEMTRAFVRSSGTILIGASAPLPACCWKIAVSDLAMSADEAYSRGR